MYEEFVMNQYEYERKKEKHVNGLAGSIVGVLFMILVLWVVHRNVYTIIILLGISLISVCFVSGIGYLYIKYIAKKVKKWENKHMGFTRSFVTLFPTIGAVLGSIIYSVYISRLTVDAEVVVMTIVGIVGVSLCGAGIVYHIFLLLRIVKK